MSKIFKILAVSIVFFGILSGIAFAEHEVLDDKAILTWDANSEEDLAGYKVYMGTESGVYGDPVDVTEPTFLFEGLEVGTYFFAVTAFDTANNESGFSNEASKTISVDPGDHTAPNTPTNLQIAEEIALGIKHSTRALVMLVEKDAGLKVE